MLAHQDPATGKTDKLRVEVGQNVGDGFLYLVENIDWDEESFPENIDGRRVRILKKNYAYLKNQVEQQIRNNQTALAELITKLIRYTFFLVVEVEEALQAFDIFERTNARGAPLNIADLLKNRLFADEALIPKLSERWDNIITASDSKLPRIFKYFDSLTNGHNTGRTVLFQHLRERVRELEPAGFMTEMETFAKFFNAIAGANAKFTRDPSGRISSSTEFDFLYTKEIFFKRVKRSLDALALMRVYVPIPAIYAGLCALRRLQSDANAFANLTKEYVKMLSVIECFHFINNGICTSPTNRAEQLYAVMAEEIFASESIRECKARFVAIQEKLRNIGLESKEKFVEEFASLTYMQADSKPMLAYIFDRLQEDPFATSPAVTIYDPEPDFFNRTYEIEHIAPKSTWEGDPETLNNIGNLVVLTMRTNRDVNAEDLSAKVKIYREKLFDNMRPVRELVEFVKNEGLQAMTPEAISKRAKMMAEYGYDQVWNPWRE